MSDIVKLYNPANADALTAADIDNLQHLTTDQIRELAVAYPNSAYQNAYLLIVDKTKDARSQSPSATSFENLYNLHAKHGLVNYVAFNFRRNFRRAPVVSVPKGQPGPVMDLSDTELMSLPGFKVLPAIDTDPVIIDEGKSVKVTKVKKEKI